MPHGAKLKLNKGQIGKAKIYIDRWRNYLGTAQFLLILIMFIRDTRLSLWYIFAGFILSLLWMYVDIRYIISAEYESQQLKNWELTGRMKKIDHIEEMLEKLTGEKK
jgi:hypothetical protein